ncbi:MAG TPA: PAS domain S-box protein [Planctomycetaceae bacterium]|nr:PAS domain S-box protein [Planctomycetaceae bacterium]
MSPENGAATDGNKLPADAESSRGSPGPSLVLSAHSLGKRGSLPLAAFLLGVGAFALTLGVVISGFLQSREDAKQRYLQTTTTEVRMLAAAIDLGREDDWEQVRKAVVEQWVQAGHWGIQPDEHFVIVDNKDGSIILNVGRHSEDPSISDPEVRRTIAALHERIGLGLPQRTSSSLTSAPVKFTGEFRSDTGQEMLGAFRGLAEPNRTPEVGRDWLVGVYRSKKGLYEGELKFGLFGTSIQFDSTGSLVLACILGMLLSLALMYYTYNLARREQARTEEARARLAAIVQNSDDAIFSQTFDGRITSWNHGAEHVFGFTESEAVNQESRTLIPSQSQEEERKIVLEIQRGESPPEHAFEAIRVRKDGRSIHVSQSVSPLDDSTGNRVGVSIIARDITARKNLEREVLEVTGIEQQRIGRDLHDSLGQELTGLSYLAKGLAKKLEEEESPQIAIAHTIADSVQRALREVRVAVQGLVPVEVDGAGFMAALEQLAAETTNRCGIDCRVEGDDRVRIEDNVVATHLFRIVQEAINNAVKHAHPREILVRPELSNGTIRVTVADDGVGFVAGAPSRNGSGMGMRIMQYRAGVIDATLEVRRQAGRGTAVVCQINNQTPASESD